jgi:Ca2+-binding EF-hand superfamily protein
MNRLCDNPRHLRFEISRQGAKLAKDFFSLLRCFFLGALAPLRDSNVFGVVGARSLGLAVLWICLPVDSARGQLKETQQVDRQDIYAGLDLDKDEKLTEEEYSGGTVGKMRDLKNEEFAAKDADHDGFLSWEEYKSRKGLKGGNPAPPPSPEKKRAEFKQLDKNKDASVSSSEYVGERIGSFKETRLKQFFRIDQDCNDQLSEEEFINPPANGAKMPVFVDFRTRDLNQDNYLSPEEFTTSSDANKAKANFARFDIDHDGKLSLEEFSLTPGKKPTDNAMFDGLDRNKDGFLTPSEFSKSSVPESRSAGYFGIYDRDLDGKLSKSEYVARASSLRWGRFWRSFYDGAMTWGTYLIIAADILLVWLVIRKVMKKRAAKLESSDGKSLPV